MHTVTVLIFCLSMFLIYVKNFYRRRFVLVSHAPEQVTCSLKFKVACGLSLFFKCFVVLSFCHCGYTGIN